MLRDLQGIRAVSISEGGLTPSHTYQQLKEMGFQLVRHHCPAAAVACHAGAPPPLHAAAIARHAARVACCNLVARRAALQASHVVQMESV